MKNFTVVKKITNEKIYICEKLHNEKFTTVKFFTMKKIAFVKKFTNEKIYICEILHNEKNYICE
jgi:hypothetical protein